MTLSQRASLCSEGTAPVTPEGTVFLRRIAIANGATRPTTSARGDITSPGLVRENSRRVSHTVANRHTLL